MRASPDPRSQLCRLVAVPRVPVCARRRVRHLVRPPRAHKADTTPRPGRTRLSDRPRRRGSRPRSSEQVFAAARSDAADIGAPVVGCNRLVGRVRRPRRRQARTPAVRRRQSGPSRTATTGSCVRPMTRRRADRAGRGPRTRPGVRARARRHHRRIGHPARPADGPSRLRRDTPRE